MTLKTLRAFQTHKIFRLCDLRNGKWRSQSNSVCNCPSNLKRVTRINWIEVDLMERKHKNMVNVLRMLLFGIAEPWARFRDITHDAIECHVHCTQCQSMTSNNDTQPQIFTFDYSWIGKRFRSGRYMKQYAIKAKINHFSELQTTDLNLADMEIFYNQIWNDFSGEKYSLVNCNCKHFAENYWQCLETVTGLKSDANSIFLNGNHMKSLDSQTIGSPAAMINNW